MNPLDYDPTLTREQNQTRDMVSLHLARTEWQFIRTILFIRQAEALQGSRHRREGETATLTIIREQLAAESERLKQILDDLDSQAV